MMCLLSCLLLLGTIFFTVQTQKSHFLQFLALLNLRHFYTTQDTEYENGQALHLNE